MQASVGIPTESADALRRGIRRSQDFLLSIQKEDGHWEGELLVDSTLCSDTVLYMNWRGSVDEVLQAKCADHIRRRQTADGGWNIFIGGPSEINASVKAYFALKLAGDSPNAPGCETPGRISSVSAASRRSIPTVASTSPFSANSRGTMSRPSRRNFLFPRWFFFNLYEMSSWSRTIIAPLAILNHYRPTRTLPPPCTCMNSIPPGWRMPTSP